MIVSLALITSSKTFIALLCMWRFVWLWSVSRVHGATLYPSPPLPAPPHPPRPMILQSGAYQTSLLCAVIQILITHSLRSVVSSTAFVYLLYFSAFSSFLSKFVTFIGFCFSPFFSIYSFYFYLFLFSSCLVFLPLWRIRGIRGDYTIHCFPLINFPYLSSFHFSFYLHFLLFILLLLSPYSPSFLP